MTIDGTLVEILRRKGFSYYDDRIKLVVDEWSINGGYNQENWYENLFEKLVLSNTISMKYQKLFDQLEKSIDEIELFGKNGILQKRIRERLKEQELDYTDETKLALDQSKANIGIKHFESLQAFLQDLWDDRDGDFQEGSKTQEGYKKGMLYMTIKDDFQDAYDRAYDRAYEKGIKIGVESIAIAMLKHKCADSVIKSVTEISEETLDRLKNKNKEDSQDTEEIARNKIYEEGYASGYEEGYASGYEEGYDIGYLKLGKRNPVTLERQVLKRYKG